ncbi:MAG: quinol dehydrogenase ferredoxin subunit NapH [Rhodospirillaceae bacterium]|jgi:ferredoxin-type protein NapH|nr:quinol dehydrogenase ferredoxin subunit NapH [Rhodospirillaceae bacterium]
MTAKVNPGKDAVLTKGWLAAHKWLVLRRMAQFGFLGAFLVGPITGFWLVKGNITSSLTLDIVPLSDPYVQLQSWFAGHALETDALIGAAIVLGVYMLIGGRMYCSWVCPVNIITDAAHWLRHRLGLSGGLRFSRSARYWLLAATFAVSSVAGVIVWELVNPVSAVYRAIVFGVGAAWMLALAVFLFDLFVSERGWCSHLCPVGAFYSLLGRFSVLRVRAAKRDACNNCMDCFAVCPENQVITPALRGADKGLGPVIDAMNCTNCGRCIDVCAPDVFQFGTRFDQSVETHDKPEQSSVLRDAA